MVFTVLISFLLIGIAIVLNQIMNNSFEFMNEHFEEPFMQSTAILTNAEASTLSAFCPGFVSDLETEYGVI